ncbi:MAG TPA: YkgJ family cysteine cluster protein [Candidatus Gracilibacteria bacterium]|nr:YkgJ family cysteine cluster protein [Candidatus Gracilibacteria bacterium]
MEKGVAAMLKAFELTDKTVQEQLATSGLKEKVACRKGCSACCEQPELPILNAEIETIGDHIKNRIGRELRRKILKKVERQKPSSMACPFLIDKACSIYAVRPLACRTFHMVGLQCRPGENILNTRFEDMVMLDSQKMNEALWPMVALIEENVEKMDKQDSKYLELAGFITSQNTPLSQMDWDGFLKYYMGKK